MSAAGSIILAARVFADKTVRPVRAYSFAWTSDASGNVSGNLTDGTGNLTMANSEAKFPGYVSGIILRVAFIPSASTAPSNNYTAKLLDGNGIDLLSGIPNANLSSTTASDLLPSVAMQDGTTTSTAPRSIDDILELQISGAGNAKLGTVVVYVR